MNRIREEVDDRLTPAVNINGIILKCILEVFDKLSPKYSFKDFLSPLKLINQIIKQMINQTIRSSRGDFKIT